jgi:hypothetical protein
MTANSTEAETDRAIPLDKLSSRGLKVKRGAEDTWFLC